MFYYILVVLACVGFLLALVFLFSDEEGSIGASVALAAITCGPAMVIYGVHVNQLAVIQMGDERITMYEERKVALQETLAAFEYPSGSPLMNKDAPIAAIVAQLADIESAYLETKVVILDAKQNIEARRMGIVSGVITIAGDYKQEVK